MWAQQSNEPASNIGMNVTGWVPTSYQNFVASLPYNGTQLSGTSQDNFDFWRYSVTEAGVDAVCDRVAHRRGARRFRPRRERGVRILHLPQRRGGRPVPQHPHLGVAGPLRLGFRRRRASASVIPGGVVAL